MVDLIFKKIMAIFQSFRINLSVRKDYFNQLFHDENLRNDNILNGKRNEFINNVFNRDDDIYFGKGDKYIYSKKGKIGDIIYGIIAKSKTRKNCFDWHKPDEKIPHFEKTLIFVNANNIDEDNWQKICILENGIDFKDNLQYLLTSLWDKSSLQNEIFELNIRPILKNYKDDFFSYFINKKEKNIQKITEIKIHYDITNHGADAIKKGMQALNATEYNKNYINKDGLELINKDEIGKDIEPIGNGINGKTIIRGIKMSRKKTEILHDSSKCENIEKTETEDWSIDEICCQNESSLKKALSLIENLYGKK